MLLPMKCHLLIASVDQPTIFFHPRMITRGYRNKQLLELNSCFHLDLMLIDQKKKTVFPFVSEMLGATALSRGLFVTDGLTTTEGPCDGEE